MSREATRELQERRRGHVDAIGVIDAALKLLGAVTGKAKSKASGTVNSTRSEAAKRMWETRRANAAKTPLPKPKTKAQRQRNNAHPVQAVSRPASLAAAAE